MEGQKWMAKNGWPMRVDWPNFVAPKKTMPKKTARKCHPRKLTGPSSHSADSQNLLGKVNIPTLANL